MYPVWPLPELEELPEGSERILDFLKFWYEYIIQQQAIVAAQQESASDLFDDTIDKIDDVFGDPDYGGPDQPAAPGPQNLPSLPNVIEGEYVRVPIFTTFSYLADLLPDDKPLLPGMGSFAEDIRYLAWVFNNDQAMSFTDPVIFMPTAVNVLGFKFGYLYTDNAGNKVTVFGLIVKYLIAVVLIDIMRKAFPMIPYGVIVAAVLKTVKPDDNTIEKMIGPYDFNAGECVKKDLTSLKSSVESSKAIMDKLNNILTVLGVKLSIL